MPNYATSPARPGSHPVGLLFQAQSKPLASAAAVEGTSRLHLDLSEEMGAFVKIISNGAAGFGGTIDTSTTFSFAGIRDLSLVLTPGADIVIVDAAPLAARARLSLDGGEGEDYLSINFTGVRNVVFHADPSGHVLSNRGSFTGFEDYSIMLGGGVNSVVTGDYNDSVTTTRGSFNTISTGDGVDEIHSAGIDRVDGGESYDFWFGNYAASPGNMVFSMNGTSGSLSNGTTLRNIESFNLITGAGNDRFLIVDPFAFVGASVDGGRGYDTLHADFSHMDFHNISVVRSDGERGFSGNFLGLEAQLSFSNIEDLTFIAGFGDDEIWVDASASRSGSRLTIDGGDGNDLVRTHGMRDGYSILPNEAGGWTVNDIDKSDGDRGQFTIRNVERLAFDDTIVQLAASPFIGFQTDDLLVGAPLV